MYEDLDSLIQIVTGRELPASCSRADEMLAAQTRLRCIIPASYIQFAERYSDLIELWSSDAYIFGPKSLYVDLGRLVISADQQYAVFVGVPLPVVSEDPVVEHNGSEPTRWIPSSHLLSSVLIETACWNLMNSFEQQGPMEYVSPDELASRLSLFNVGSDRSLETKFFFAPGILVATSPASESTYFGAVDYDTAEQYLP